MKKLEGKVIVVFGASGGIGSALSHVFLAEGAHVVLSARTESKLLSLQQRLGQENTTVAPLDATDGTAVERLLADLKSAHGRVDAVVVTAGTWQRLSIDSSLSDALKLAPEHYKAIFLPSFVSGFVAQRFFRRQGDGLIVSISSHAAVRPELRGNLTYGPMKAAVRHLMFALREELKGTKVRVVDIQPAIVNTPDNQKLLDTDEKRQEAVQPEQIGRRIVNLFDDPNPPAEILLDSSVVL